MNIAEIENLSADELKTRREGLKAELAVEIEPETLALRFLQAREDAKRRDEKLSEQGKEITKLQAAVDVATTGLAKSAKETESLRAGKETAEQRAVELAEENAKLRSENSRLAQIAASGTNHVTVAAAELTKYLQMLQISGE